MQVYPQSQGISLVTTSSILSADITTFSSQVPTILTEGDAEDTDTQFHVITTSSVLTHPGTHLQSQAVTSDTLGVMATPVDFGRSGILSEQQQVLITGMMVGGATVDQAVQINLPDISENSVNEVSTSFLITRAEVY